MSLIETLANHALLRTVASRRGCNPRVSGLSRRSFGEAGWPILGRQASSHV